MGSVAVAYDPFAGSPTRRPSRRKTVMNDRWLEYSAEIADRTGRDAFASPHAAAVETSALLTHAAGFSVGGDWCETYRVSDRTLAISIGDACGHGPAASAMMTPVRRTLVSAMRAGDRDIAAVLAGANARLCGEEPGSFVTAIFGYVDLVERTLRFASAGHPPPLLAGPTTSHFVRFGRVDVPLGLDRTFEPSVHVVAIPNDAMLVLYTDGVTEHERDAARGELQLASAAMAFVADRDMSGAAGIAHRMGLTGCESDDAAIATVWIPPDTGADSRHGPTRRRLPVRRFPFRR